MPKRKGLTKDPLDDEIENEDDEKANNAGDSSILKPRRNDVLLGRGRPYQTFAGNLRMLQIVADHKAKYNSKPRDEKRAYVEQVLDMILEGGTRFLRHFDEGKNSERWEKVDRLVAANKVWHALRCKGKKSKPKITEALDEMRNQREATPMALADHSARIAAPALANFWEAQAQHFAAASNLESSLNFGLPRRSGFDGISLSSNMLPRLQAALVTQIPITSTDSQTPLSVASSQIPVALTAAQIPPRMNAAQIQPIVTTAQIQPTITNAHLPAAMVASQIPSIMTATQLPAIMAAAQTLRAATAANTTAAIAAASESSCTPLPRFQVAHNSGSASRRIISEHLFFPPNSLHGQRTQILINEIRQLQAMRSQLNDSTQSLALATEADFSNAEKEC